jgi:hypothetical protein
MLDSGLLFARVARGMFFEFEHRHGLGPFVKRELTGLSFDGSQLVQRGTARKAVTRTHTIGRNLERSARALQKVVHRVLVTDGQIFFDDVGRGIASNGFAVGPTHAKMHLGHDD